MFDVIKYVDLETGGNKHMVTVVSTALTSSENEGDSTRSMRMVK